MFELSVACKYLLPKRRQLSVSVISLISIIVIALVIWLILVFFSVTKGLEKGWIDKLVTLTAPIRITPTEQYYHSYYYQIDHHSQSTDYTFRSIGDKKKSAISDPYLADVDGDLPDEFPKNEHLDLVKLAFESADALPGVTAAEYEVTSANLRLRLLRRTNHEWTESFLSQPIYLGTFEENNPALKKILIASVEKTLKNESKGHGVFAPKSFRDAGVLIGDSGFISYFAPTASSLQEQRLPVFVAGFYDPGIVPLGGKFILANPVLVNSIRTAQGQEGTPMTNGINIRFDNIKEAGEIKLALERELEKRNISQYWNVETYRDFDYAKDLLQQLSSEKNIFSLIAAVIIIVACSNIISMLIILVKDKRLEIGILRSMGATSASIALIFGFCGVAMGLAGTLIGTVFAYFTLQNINSLLGLISKLQGYDAFNPVFYGDSLPSSMSYETFIVVLVATGVISLLAGLIPAIKASKIKPANILRSEWS